MVERQKKSLTYPTLHLCKLIDCATLCFEEQMKPNLHERYIQRTVTMMLASFDNLSWVCTEYKTSGSIASPPCSSFNKCDLSIRVQSYLSSHLRQQKNKLLMSIKKLNNKESLNNSRKLAVVLID